MTCLECKRLRRECDECKARRLAANEWTPGKARALWQWLVRRAPTDEQATTVLNDVLTSAVIDYITNEIETSDEYALVIAHRIRTLDGALTAGKAKLEAASSPARAAGSEGRK